MNIVWSEGKSSVGAFSKRNGVMYWRLFYISMAFLCRHRERQKRKSKDTHLEKNKMLADLRDMLMHLPIRILGYWGFSKLRCLEQRCELTFQIPMTLIGVYTCAGQRSAGAISILWMEAKLACRGRFGDTCYCIGDLGGFGITTLARESDRDD